MYRTFKRPIKKKTVQQNEWRMGLSAEVFIISLSKVGKELRREYTTVAVHQSKKP